MTMTSQALTIEDVYGWLEDVKDPEIPVLSLVDLGVMVICKRYRKIRE